MKKKHFKLLILIIFLFTSVFLAFNPILITDKSSRNQSSEESTASDKKSPQSPLASTWILNGTPVITETNNQRAITMCSDDDGGAIIVWEDVRTGLWNVSIYAQKINSDGDIVWTSFPDGVPIWTNTSLNWVDVQICSDGEGGAIITWMDNRSGRGWSFDIYAQRINSTGGLEWTPQGVPICTNRSVQYFPRIVGLDSGGAIIAWEDFRLGNRDIFAQRIDSDGNKQWFWKMSDQWDGIPVCTQTNDQYFMGAGGICSDGADGAIIAWYDYRTGFSNVAVYAQRIDFNGNRYSGWANDGEAICTITNTLMNPSPRIISDEVGGAIIAWDDNRTGGIDRYHDIYAQKVNSTGDTQWTDQGVGICTAAFDQNLNDITYDGANGAIIIWEDNRGGSDDDLYSQKVNSTGEMQWTPNGVVISTENGDQGNAKICNDGTGGIFAVWEDERDGENEDDIYVQYINSKGISQWTTDGVIVCNKNDEQEDPVIICNAAGSVIIVWEDHRSGTNDDIYAYRFINAAPTSNHPGTVTTTVGGTETIDWILYDDRGGGNYRVIANNSVGDFYTWIDWTSWYNNTPLNIPINTHAPGIYNYTIEYYDEFHLFGNPDTVLITIEGLLFIQILNQSFTSDEFNITFLVSDWLGAPVNPNIDNIEWNGTAVPPGDIQSPGTGLIKVSLIPITVLPGEDPILLNMTLSAPNFQDLNYEIPIAIDPDVIDKEPKPSIPPPSDDDDDDDDDDDEEIEFLVPTLILIGFISAIGVAIYLFRKRKSI